MIVVAAMKWYGSPIPWMFLLGCGAWWWLVASCRGRSAGVTVSCFMLGAAAFFFLTQLMDYLGHTAFRSQMLDLLHTYSDATVVYGMFGIAVLVVILASLMWPQRRPADQTDAR